MKFTYRVKLFVVLLIFATLITFSIAIFDFKRLKEQIIEDKEAEIEQVTRTIEYAIHSTDKAYFYLDEKVDKKMEESTMYLQSLYEKNKDMSKWNFEQLSEKLGVDIFILNQDNVIVYSNKKSELGLDFEACCHSLSEVLHDRRQAKELFIDGIDVEQETGSAKKYSYMGTADGKFLIELGYDIEEEPIFQAFNFIDVSEQLEAEFSLVDDVQVLNYGGIPIGKKERKEDIPPYRMKAVAEIKAKGETVEAEGEHKGQDIMYRYVPYESEFDEGTTKLKVLEIKYSNNELELILQEYRNGFYFQLLIIFFVTLLLTAIIAKIFAKPVYLAYHDSLTNLRNRASFDDCLQTSLETEKQTILLMMDLDNFKLVNDHLGHDRGDKLLQEIAQTLQAIGGKETTFRIGGDEFVILLKNESKEKVRRMAEEIQKAMKDLLATEETIDELNVSISIGIAMSEANDTASTLYKRADIALYQSKYHGKRSYQFYQHSDNLQISLDRDGTIKDTKGDIESYQ